MLISFLDSDVTLGIRFQDLHVTLECTAAAVFEIHDQNVIRIVKYVGANTMTLRVDLHVLVRFVLESTAALHIAEQLIVPFSFVGKNSHLYASPCYRISLIKAGSGGACHN